MNENLQGDGSDEPLVGEGASLLRPLATSGGFVKKRHVMIGLLLSGLANVYAMRVNLSSAVEPMQKKYGWSNVTQGYVLSAFFWGYLVFQIPGAVLALRYGGKRVFGLGILGTAVLQLLVPLCADHLWLLLVLRALMGLFESVTFPSMNVLFTKWVPCSERSLLVSVAHSGAYLGTAVAFPISGVLIDLRQGSDGVSTTWPYVFYLFGSVGIAWFLVWELLASSAPREPSCMPITLEESQYIEATAGLDADTTSKVEVEKSERPPWKAMCTHSAAWAIYSNHFANNFCFYTLLTYLPKYLDEQLGFSLKDAGGIAVVPYLLQVLASFVSGTFADYVIAKYSVRTARLVVELVSFSLSCSMLIVCGWMTDTAWAVVCVSIAIGSTGLVGGGFLANYVDLSPHHAGSLYAVGNVFANLAGVVAPIVVGYVLGDEEYAPDATDTHTPTLVALLSEDETSDSGSGFVPASHWRNVFYISASIYVAAAVLWVLLMQSKPVPELN